MNENEQLMMKVMAELTRAKAPIIFKGAIVEIVQFFLSLDTNEHRNTTRPLMHSRTQGFPCCRGRIRRARCAAMKE